MIEQQVQQAEAARQSFAEGLAQNAAFTIAAVLADCPEIQGLNAQQVPVALSIIEKQDPQRFAAIRSKLASASAIMEQTRQIQAAQAQQTRAAFHSWALEQDKALLDRAPELADAGVSDKTARAALKSLKDAGFTEQEIARAWHGDPVSLRDHRSQLLLWKASRFDEAMAGIAHPSQKPVPPVQRPGIARSTNEAASDHLGELNREFRKASGTNQLRLGAKLLSAQRRARS